MNTNDYDLFDICALTAPYGFIVCVGILMGVSKEVMCGAVGAVTVAIVMTRLCGGKEE